MKKNKLLKLTIFLMVSIAALIFASIVLFQHLIENQENDGTIINLAGRQRMLSQKITKNCVLIAAYKDTEKKTEFFEILKEDLHNFTSIQNKLIALDNSSKITNLFNSSQNSYKNITSNATKIMLLNNHKQKKYLFAILENEPLYLKNMDTIVSTYTIQNQTKIIYLKKNFISVNIIIVVFIVFTVSFVVNPLIKKKELSELKLTKALIQEKELNELKTQFVSTASHEFRTPLSAINFAAGSIKKYAAKMEPIAIVQKLHKIEDQVKYMTKLLNNIFIAGSMEVGQMSFNPLHMNLGNFIDEILEEVYSFEENLHKIILIDTGELKNSTIFIDEILGRNIFVNIISNALKFSPDADKITIEFSSEKDHTVISVTDFGIGIPKSELKKIFNPFTRGKNVELFKGTGLGLSIAKDAIDIIGGKIIIHRNNENGTTFLVKIPKI